MTSHKSLLNSPGVTLWWLHQRFHLTPDHSSHGSPRSDGQNKPDASEMNQSKVQTHGSSRLLPCGKWCESGCCAGSSSFFHNAGFLCESSDDHMSTAVRREKKRASEWCNDFTFSFGDPGQGLFRRRHHLFGQISHVHVFLWTVWKLRNETTRQIRNERRTTYVVPFTNLQRFSFPAFTEQICDRLVVDLHVAHAQEELLLWTLEETQAVKCSLTDVQK